MTELEMEIARTLGATSFLVYQTVKSLPGTTSNEVIIETGLSESCVTTCLSKLKRCNVVEMNRVYPGDGGSRVTYNSNEKKETWKFH